MIDLRQVTPDTLAVLQELHQTNLRLEQAALVEEEELVCVRREYEAEVVRQGAVLQLLTGLQEQMGQGLCQSYLSTVTELCLTLGQDSLQGAGLEAGLAKLLIQQVSLLSLLSLLVQLPSAG